MPVRCHVGKERDWEHALTGEASLAGSAAGFTSLFMKSFTRKRAHRKIAHNV